MNNVPRSDSESAFEFEARLSHEMQRVPAPQGFAGRIMDRVETQAAQQRRGRLIVMPRRSAWMAIAAMLLVGILIGMGSWQRHQQNVRREREQAEQIQRQFDLAMQVTQRTLAEVQQRIGHAGEVQKSERQ